MPEREPQFSRVGRKRQKNKSNLILNSLIGIVVVLIIIVGATIITGGNDDQADGDKQSAIEKNEKTDSTSDKNADSEDTGQNEPEGEGSLSEDQDDDGAAMNPEDDSELSGESGSNDEKHEVESPQPEEGELVKIESPDDPVVSETVINESWKPIGTVQTGEHTSLYDGESDDWNEKKKALAYATGLPEDSMIFKRIKNGGSPQKSIGIVSSSDGSEKYRVYLEWVDGQGWKPVKMDKLTTLDFDY